MWLSSNRGLTLIELLVALVILSILAAAALPYAEVTVRREKELELRQALRQVRSAIDQSFAVPLLHNIRGIGYRLVDPNEL